jgi:omega-hydroxy-beta-dihydromenaquinone-9 sulfotransferase
MSQDKEAQIMAGDSDLRDVFIDALAAWPGFAIAIWRARPGGWFFLALAPLAFLVWLTHWCCLLLDELFFPAYRHLEIKQPLFIIGPPRTGTTHLHRVMAGHEDTFTTTRTWELFLAPSIVQKKILRMIYRGDQRCGGGLMRLAEKSERSFTKATDHLHKSSLTQPEEDFYFLLLALACPALMVALPQHRRSWQAAFFNDAPPRTRQAWLTLYHRCLQKHLFVFGEGRRLLSKNASANPWLRDLAHAYPDATFAVCSRDPAEAIASMNSLAERIRDDLGVRENAPADPSASSLTALMHHHYACLHRILPELPDDRWFNVPIEAMRHDLDATVRALCAHTGVDITPAFATSIKKAAIAASHYRSGHHYRIEKSNHAPNSLDAAWRFLRRDHSTMAARGTSA